MKIWVTDKDGYPGEGGIDGFYASEEAAIRGLKERFSAPYQVTWREQRTDEGVTLTGDFLAVDGYSTEHTSRWFIQSEDVLE